MPALEPYLIEPIFEQWGAPIPPDTPVSQLLLRSDVELHPHRGGEIGQAKEKPRQGVQAPVLPAGSHRREAPRPDLPRAQPLGERAAALEIRVPGSRRGRIHAEATLRRRSPRSEDRRAGALLWAIVSGESDPKKVAREHTVAQRHAVIERVREEHPRMPIEKLCSLMGVSRSWYYARPSATEKAKKDVQLRDAIERIVLEFPGYGYRRVSAALRREGWIVNHKRVL